METGTSRHEAPNQAVIQKDSFLANISFFSAFDDSERFLKRIDHSETVQTHLAFQKIPRFYFETVSGFETSNQE